jgi:hypothetical protein
MAKSITHLDEKNGIRLQRNQTIISFDGYLYFGCKIVH